MDKNKLNLFKNKLLKEKQSILETINLMDENSKDRQEFSTELSLCDNHPADIATEVYIVGQNTNLRGNQEVLLSKVESALEKVETREYGVCKDCGKEIDESRLDVIPYVSRCMECENENKENETLQDKQGYRPVEEDSLKYPFGRTFKDSSKEEVMLFDGEDSWQAVDRYNIVVGDPSYRTGDQLGVVDEDEDLGCVEEVEKISQEDYIKQLQ